MNTDAHEALPLETPGALPLEAPGAFWKAASNRLSATECLQGSSASLRHIELPGPALQ